MYRRISIFFGLLLLAFQPAIGAPVPPAKAALAVKGWLEKEQHPLGRPLSTLVKRTEAVKDASGNILYYVAHLDPAGYVILAADDAADPIVAFSATGSFDSTSKSPMVDIMNRDMPRRLARAKSGVSKSRAKWDAFVAGSANPPPDSPQNGAVVVASQIWVAPFIHTEWNQQLDMSQTSVYNYYTPPNEAGNLANYPCGCVATCLAQVMYYFQYPTTSVGTTSFSITVNGQSQQAHLRGGNGSGGPYQWNQMPLAPNNSTAQQAQAIGALCYDAGVAVQMDYEQDSSSAYTYLSETALTTTFKYSNAAYYEQDSHGLSGDALVNMVNPSLDARTPVMLGINSPQVGGHCLVADGYGYSSGTLFHHVNAGWGGDNDIWYALPAFNTADNGDFNVVQACVYNIFINGSGEIISGRITDPTGAPVAGASISAAGTGGPFTTTSDTNGIYALKNVHSASSYTLTVTKNGSSSATNVYATGTSPTGLNSQAGGDVWGANFVLTPQLLATPENGFTSIGPVGGPFSVASKNYVLTNGFVSSINWVISNTNSWLAVTSSNGTLAGGATSSMTISLSAAANGLSGGSYTGSVWITNLNNNLAQELKFSLIVATADYPIAVTGYNEDVIVEANAQGGNTYNFADTFDPAYPHIGTPRPVCFYESGLNPVSAFDNITLSTGSGLPAGGMFTSLVDGTTFQLGPYNGSNVLCLTQSAGAGSLALATPAGYKSLKVLAASAQGGGTGSLVLHFADGTSSSAISFDAPEYLVSSPGAGVAIKQFGSLLTGGPSPNFECLDFDSDYPALFQTSIDLQGLGLDGKIINSITFTRPAGANTMTGVFALSGTQVAFNANYLLNAVASPSVGGMVSGGGSFGAGTTNTVSAVVNSNYVFAYWTVNGTVVSIAPDYTFVLNGDTTLVANFLTHFAVNVEASPAEGGTVSGSGTVLQGSTALFYETNNPGYVFLGWTGDGSGMDNPLQLTVNANLNVVANFALASSNILWNVSTNSPGAGSVTPNLNGKVLTAGKAYTLKATPAAGYLFSNWVGSITTNKNPLTLKAASNLVLQANFVLNPFLALKGVYNGLFSVSNDVEEVSAGLLKGLSITEKGTYSGAIMLGGASHGISGTFSLGGQTTNLIKRTTAQGGNVSVSLTSAGNPPQIMGTISGSWGTSYLLANRATNMPSAEYTMLLEPDNNNSPPFGSPGGESYALITNKAGTATITGALADGTALSQTVPVSIDGYVPVYANLYSGKGMLTGWINLTLTNHSGVGLTWIHPSAKSGLYKNGFTNVLSPAQILLSQWINPGNFSLLTTVSLFDTIGDSAEASSPINIASTGKITGTGVTGSVTPKTGAFTISVGSRTLKVSGKGALFDSTSGGGFFLTKSNSQAIRLGP